MISQYLPPAYFPFGEEEDKEPEVVCRCAKCGGKIHVGDDAWNVGGKFYCEDCIRASKIRAIYA